jgi:catechol 2,3-dioxygenase
MTTSAQVSYFAPRRLGHVNLWVKDLPTSERFYSEVCGLTVEFSEPDLIATFLGTGHTPHDLGMIQTTKGIDRYGKDGLLQLPGSIGVHVGLNHLAWELHNEAALIEGFRRLKTDHVATDITVDHQVAHSVYMFDPDGNYNEFYCDTVKDWRGVLHGPMELITSQWDPLTSEGFTVGRYDTNPVLRNHPTAPVHPWRITHAVLGTAQIDKMVDFYTSVAGLRIVSQEGGVVYLGATLAEYQHNLVLIPTGASSYHHASFQLKDDATLNQAIEGLKAVDVRIEQVVDLPWKRAITLRDPDGLLSEWYVQRDAPRRLSERGTVDMAHAA